jgi:hypothetical protein
MLQLLPHEAVELIDKTFPWISKQNAVVLNWGHVGAVSTLLSAVDSVPGQLLEVPKTLLPGFLAALSFLRASVQMWQGGNKQWEVASVPGFEPHHPVILIHSALEACPDAVPDPATSGLEFIKDDVLRKALRLDVSAANTALGNGEWKAATVLAGSVAEALLLWALTTLSSGAAVRSAVAKVGAAGPLKGSKPSGSLDDWGLAWLSEVAGELMLLKPNTLDELRLAKNYRNLIHPGKTQRTGEVCDRGTARVALGAVDHLIRDLTP